MPDAHADAPRPRPSVDDSPCAGDSGCATPYVSIGGRLRGSYFVVAAAAARAAGADLVFTRNPRIARLACGLGLDVVLESHLVADPELARDLAASPHLKRWVFISERLRDLHGDAAITAGARCVVAHDGVDLARFTPVLPPCAARDLLGIGVTGQLVVHSGHLYAGRGAELLLDVARALPDVQIAFVGGADADVKRMRERAVGLTNVRFAGHRPSASCPRGCSPPTCSSWRTPRSSSSPTDARRPASTPRR